MQCRFIKVKKSNDHFFSTLRSFFICVMQFRGLALAYYASGIHVMLSVFVMSHFLLMFNTKMRTHPGEGLCSPSASSEY